MCDTYIHRTKNDGINRCLLVFDIHFFVGTTGKEKNYLLLPHSRAVLNDLIKHFDVAIWGDVHKAELDDMLEFLYDSCGTRLRFVFVWCVRLMSYNLNLIWQQWKDYSRYNTFYITRELNPPVVPEQNVIRIRDLYIYGTPELAVEFRLLQLLYTAQDMEVERSLDERHEDYRENFHDSVYQSLANAHF